MTFAPVEAEINVLLVEPAGGDVRELDPQFADAALTIHPVTDVDAARRVLDETVIDCVVCVHDPPRIDGVEALSVVQEDIPVLLAMDAEQSTRHVIEAGVTDVLSLTDGRIDVDVVTNRITNSVVRSRNRGKFEQLFEQANDGIAIHDPETGDVLEANRRLSELLGREPTLDASIQLSNLAAGEAPYTAADLRERVCRVSTDGPTTFEWLLGEDPTWVEISLKPATIAGRERVLSFTRNVADRKAQERLIRDRQRQFEAVFDHPDSFTTVLDPDGRIRRANRPALELIGATESDVEGKHLSEMDWWGDDEAARERIREAIETAAAGESTRLEVDVSGAPDEHVVNISFQPITDGDDTAVDSIIAVGYDITARKQRERALRGSREALAHLHDITADPERSFERQVDDLLAFGCSYLGTDLAFLSRIDEADGRFELVRTHGDHPMLESGAEYDLGMTYCRHTIAGDDDPLAINDAAAEGMADDPAYVQSGLSCYIGSEITVDDEFYGTLCFADIDPRETPLSATESTVVNVIRQWLQYELERDAYRTEIEETRDRLERILERVDDGFFALDDEWRITYANEQGAAVLRGAMGADYGMTELLGRLLWDEIPEAVDTPFYDRYHEAMETQEAVAFESYFEPLDTWFGVNAYPDQNGISVYFQDITGRKRRERALDDLLATTQEFMQARTEHELAEQLAESTSEILGYDATIVRFHDAEDGTLSPAVLSRAGAERLPDPPDYDDDEGIAGRVFQSGDHLVVDDLLTETAYEYGPYRSAVVLPLGDHGTLGIGSEAAHEFDSEDVALAELLATTARVALDRLAREAELRRFRHVIEHVEEMVFLLDPDGAFTFVTEPVADFLGYGRDELDDRTLGDFVPSVDHDSYTATLSMLDEADGERSVTVETSVVTASGAERPVELALSTFPPTVAESGVVGTLTDIRELTKTRAQLEAERDRFQHLFDNLPDPVVEVEIGDDGPVIQHVNPAFADVFGHEPDTIRGRRLDDLLSVQGQSLDELMGSRDEDARADGRDTADERTSTEAQRETADGRRDFLIRRIPYPREDRQYSFGIYTDITEQKERERYLQVLNRVLRHNLRNDLNVIMLSAEWLVDHVEGELKERAETLRDNANELAGLSEKAKQIERMIGRRGDETGPIDAVPLLRRIVADHGDAHPESSLSVDLPEELWVRADDDVARVFEELVENAIVHNDDPQPALRIEASEGEDWTEIRFHDDARGIPDDEWQVITGEAEITQLTHSSGLGLWLVRWVIDSYGGEVRRHRTDDGTTIELRLRRADHDGA
jgi:PAS domain S-box-containing protein